MSSTEHNHQSGRTVTYGGLTFEPYISHERIMRRIDEIGKEITREYEGKTPLLLCVLNGSMPFAADLFRAIDTDAEIAFTKLASYEGTSTTGVVREVMPITTDITGRDVIIVEDIVDTGNTIKKLLADLQVKNPASVKVATLLFKPEALVQDVKPDYVGFEIPKKFIIGFGLDLDGRARNLKDIWVLKEHD